MTNKYGLYIHIPFCASICTYCDFPKRLCNNKKLENDYFTRLLEELDSYAKYFNSNLNTIYIGGGTPNSASLENLERLFKKLKSFNLDSIEEFSVETNPELITEEQALLFKKYGVNRVSMGVQSFLDKNLKVINRKHTKEDVVRDISILKKHGIDNINIDMMFGLPNQSINDLKEDIRFITSLDIKHISYYNLILEEKTILYHEVSQGVYTLPDEDVEADMFSEVIDSLGNKGFKQYEISNFSKDGFLSIHNLHYWSNNDYIGVGLGASGYLDNSLRYTNTFNLTKYIEGVKPEITVLSLQDKKAEYIIMGLRKTSGISLDSYYETFGVKLTEEFDIKDFIDEKLLTINQDNYLKFTQKGLMIGNIIFERFI